MGWSLKLGELGGIAVRVHFTFLLLLAWLGTLYWMQGGPQLTATGLLFIVSLFGCVVLHEFGHAMAARLFGVTTQDITLLPIGGIASLSHMPEKPAEEIIVALAGPAVNVLIAAVLVYVFGAELKFQDLSKLEEGTFSFIGQLATVNIALAVFNMIPAFPMDGGRVLRASLGFAMSRPEATRLAARIGQTLAFAFALFGLLGNPILVLIAIFIYFAASAEAYEVDMADAARGYRAGDAMIVHFESLPTDATVDDAANLLLKTAQGEFPVVGRDSRLRGFVTRQIIIDAIAEAGGSAPISEVMLTDTPTHPPSASLDGIVRLLGSSSAPVAVGIVDPKDRLLGFVTQENLAELLLIRRASAVRATTRLSPHPSA